MSVGADEDISGFDKKSNWDIAVRYQDLKRLVSIKDEDKALFKKRAIKAILDQARSAVGPMQKPIQKKSLSAQECNILGVDAEFDMESSIEEIIGAGKRLNSKELLLEHFKYNVSLEKEASVVVVMDASLSMTSEKIALLAVAAAVVSLSFQSTKVAFIAFASKSKVIKTFEENLTPEQVIERILEIPTHGLTNIEAALISAAKTADAVKDKKSANVVLISDGKYTEGKDPMYLAKKFRHLYALKIGRDIAGQSLLLDLVRSGNGRLFSARKMQDLPKTMYSVLRLVMR